MTQVLSKLLRVLGTGSAFLLFWSAGSILSWVVVPGIGLYYMRDRDRRTRTCRLVVSRGLRYFTDYMRTLRLIDFDGRDIEGQLPSGPFVLTANHPTLIDVVLLLSVHPDLCVVVKPSVFNGPYVSVMLRLCDHLDAGDGSAVAGMLVVNGALERLSRGIPVLIFPEGTRSPAESMHPFKSGAFMIACQAKVPVVPLVIRCEPRTLMKGVPWYTVPDRTARITMSVLPPIATERYGEDLRALKADVRAVLERQLVGSEALPAPEAPALALT